MKEWLSLATRAVKALEAITAELHTIHSHMIERDTVTPFIRDPLHFPDDTP